jgi:hypothetical protein
LKCPCFLLSRNRQRKALRLIVHFRQKRPKCNVVFKFLYV